MSNQKRYRLYLQMDHMRMHQKKRTANFREDETKLLIQLWGSPNIQNKLFLTHRKAPVMRLLAAHMQQRGFYRTPDEIKTRIRNLKCLYHRIKRTMACGQGIGTVDPDWPHFKAMDDILSKESPRKDVEKIMEEALDGPKIEDVVIKQEVEDIDIDDNDSWVTNESVNKYENDCSSDYEDDNPPPPLKPAPIVQHVQGKASISQPKLTPICPATSTSSGQKLPTILPAFSLPNTQMAPQNTANKSLPFPLLILNNLQPQHQQQQMNKTASSQVLHTQNGNVTNTKVTHSKDEDTIKELLKVQKESLVIQKEKLELEKQRLEFNRLIGTQMMTLLPMLGGILQRVSYTDTEELLDIKVEPGEEGCEVGVKRKRENNEDILKDCKILRNMLEQGIKKYMMIGEDNNTKDSSENEDNCIPNDEQSNFSDKSGDK
ncbi:PREDICTED: uncharacterized protein LOC108563679 isoform X2 [Nicrophorus vespilloides]|uniref:Uncharacterized protein LOC108563679 isoform X2 n=1 Tax=Nicrophorus vespilloides TaxID=110193 RepID=A0ABM1MTM1_NICVS|nr:PREDICTED: uncharacterized protein LOC108563679 isoform X2 [Nicrophorus vespilloides]